ncbi:PTS glucose transporter subunit IIA [Robertmurraya sp. DFI.2.37]|nr:PTS glucose transporter subunit IIA [Robertmurraya sp. DFI.2.37]MDF1510338.1 PTS glucose transporter subunit IIA [Robertmurraya sp. DFI.2.37]
MSIFKKFIDKIQDEKKDSGDIFASMDGKVIPLKEIEDGVFSEGMLGKGCGMKPSVGEVYAPFDGEVMLITPTKHAIALKNKEGIELLIHVGIDTVKMNGEGFQPLVEEGDRVKCGQPIMTFSISDIEEAGYATTTAIIVTNSEKFPNEFVLITGERKRQESIMHIS